MRTFTDNNLSLVLFFTKGISLQAWYASGVLEREVALYKMLQNHGTQVSFVTYGDKRDLDYAANLPGITICCNHEEMPAHEYEQAIPHLHRATLEHADVIKTNQTIGADIALKSAQHFSKPLVARCGFMRSEFDINLYGQNSEQAEYSLSLEKHIFNRAEQIIVTTDKMKESILSRFPNEVNAIKIIPNYVDTEVFAPNIPNHSSMNTICYVGRLEQKQKNILSLIEAIDGLDIKLYIIGSGPLRNKVEEASNLNSNIIYVANKKNIQLPDILNTCDMFVLPSFYEGHPKALIEAMACGLPVIGTNVPGINNVIQHGETGLLCNTDTASLRQAISTLAADTALQKRLGKNAREFVVNNYALDKIATLELNTYQELLNGTICQKRYDSYAGSGTSSS